MSNDLIDRIKAYLNATGNRPRFVTAAPETIQRAEARLGFSLPSFLKRCYIEIANGGFGPAYGLFGIENGHRSDWGDIVDFYQVIERDYKSEGRIWTPALLPFCEYGCAIFWCVKCDSSEEICTLDQGKVWPQDYGLETFFEMWLNGVDIYTSDPTIETVESTWINPFRRREETIRTLRRRDG
jgi:hypothetical protein